MSSFDYFDKIGPSMINPTIQKANVIPIGSKDMKNVHDPNFDAEFQVGYNKILFYKHYKEEDKGTQGLFYKQVTNNEKEFNDISSFPLFKLTPDWNELKLEEGKEYVFFRKIDEMARTCQYARIKLLDKPKNSITNINSTFNSTFDLFSKGLSEKEETLGQIKLNVGVFGSSGDGKSVLISSMKTIMGSQEYQRMHNKFAYMYFEPEKKNLSKKIIRHEDNEAFNLIEVPLYFDNIDSDEMTPEIHEELKKLHSIVLTIEWKEVSDYMLADRFKNFDKKSELYKQFSQDIKDKLEIFEGKVKQIKKIRAVNPTIPIIIALTKSDGIPEIKLEKFQDIFENPFYFSSKSFLENFLKEKFQVFLTSGFKTFLEEIDENEYYSKGYMTVSIFHAAFQSAALYAYENLSEAEKQKIANESHSFSKSIWTGVTKAYGVIEKYKPTITDLYYCKSKQVGKLEDADIAQWKSIAVEDKNFTIEGLEPQTEYIGVLKKAGKFILKPEKFKTKRAGNEPVDNIVKALEIKLEHQSKFRLNENYLQANLQKLNIGIYGQTNSGKSSLIAAIRTAMKNKNKLLNKEVLNFEYVHPTPRSGSTKKVKRTDFEHNNHFSAYEFSEANLKDLGDYEQISVDVERKIHAGIFLIDASTLKELIQQERIKENEPEQTKMLKIIGKDDIKVNFIISKLDEVFPEETKKLNYNQIIEHPFYLEMREYLGKKFGHNIKIFPLISFSDNPFLEFPSDDALENYFKTLSYMCLDIFNSAIDEANSYLRSEYKCIVVRQRRKEVENKLISSFFIKRNQHREHWEQLKELISTKITFKSEVVFLDPKFKQIPGQAETRNVTEERDGCIFVNFGPKEKNQNNEAKGELIDTLYFFFSNPIDPDFLQVYSNLNSHMTLLELRKYLENPENRYDKLPEFYKFCRLKQKIKGGNIAYTHNHFDIISLAEEASLKIKKITYTHSDFGDDPLLFTISGHIKLEVYDEKEELIHTLTGIERESASLTLIRTKLESANMKLKNFLRVENIRNKSHKLVIMQASEEKFALSDVDIEKEDDSERVFKIYVKV